MTVSVSNTNLTDSFNSWRLNTNLAATVISNNAITAYRAGSSARGKAVIGNTHLKGTLSAVELRTDTIKGGNAAMGTTGKSGAIVIASNTSITSTSLTVAANTTFTGNVIFTTAGTDRINLGSIDRVIVSGGSVGQFLRIAGPASDNPQFKSLTLRDITDLSSNSSHIVLSGANTTFSAGAKDSPHLILAGGSNSGADRFHIFAGDNTTAGDDDLIIQLTDSVGDSNLNINNAANTTMATISSRGILTANGASFNGNVLHGDSVVSNWGAGSDLSIYHDGSHSYITDSGTGQLYIRSNYLSITNAAGNETMTFFDDDGAVSLYFDNAVKLATKTDGVLVTGELEATTLDINGAADISGTTLLNGDVTLGDATADTITVKGNFANQHTEGTASFTKLAIKKATVASGVDLEVGRSMKVGKNLQVVGNTVLDGNMTVTGSLNTSGGLAIQAANGTFTGLTVTGNTHLGNATSDKIVITGIVEGLTANGTIALSESAKITLADGTIIVGKTGKLHANNAITNSTIKGVMLENSGVSAATYGSATTFPIVTVDAQGLLTGVTTGTLNDATASVKGIASFSTDNFAVSSGAVTIKNDGVILGTETTGAYVSTLTGTSNEVNVSGSGSETATVTVGLPDDVTITQDLTVGRHLLMGDNDTIKLGAGTDLSIYSGGSSGVITAPTNLRIYTADFGVSNAGASESMISAVENGAVSLYYDNAVKLATVSGGVTITGATSTTTLAVSSTSAFSGDTSHADSVKAKFGTGNDLQIHHDGSNSYIDDTGTGLLHIRGSQVNINKYTGENMATFVADGAVTLMYDHSAKLATVTGGVLVTGELEATTLDINGNADISGNLTVGGTLAGAIEADTVIAAAENSDTQNFIAFFNAATGAQAMKTDTGLTYNAATNALTTTTFVGALTGAVTGNVTGNVSGNVTGNVTGNASGTAATVTTAAQPAITSVGTLTGLSMSGDLDLQDDDKILLGTHDDLQIYHDGSNSYIKDTATGSLYIDGSTNVNIRMGHDGGETAIQCVDDGAVSLYYNNAVKLATASGGVTITGTATATTFSGSGASLTSLPAGNLTGTVASARLTGTYAISVSGVAATATVLATTRAINGVNFNGSAAITVEPYVEDDESTNAARYLTFVDSTTAGHKRLNEDSALAYNPSTNTLTAGIFSGSGASLTSTGRIISVQEFTSSGTWSRPSGCTRVHVVVVGGGGGAQTGEPASKKGSAYTGRNGGYGGSAEEVIDVSGTASVSVTIGSGGGTGAAGGTTSFGGFCSATGGGGGAQGSTGSNGSGSGGHINRSNNFIFSPHHGERGEGTTGTGASGTGGYVYVINY